MPTRQAARRLVKKTGPTRRAGAARPARPESIDEYLAAVPVDKRRALAKLRTQIRAAAPEATEGISYGVPTFKLEGRLLVSFGAAAAHCSLYGVSGTDATGAQLAELESYDTSGKGTVRFAADKPLPQALVTKLVKARIARLKKASGTTSGVSDVAAPRWRR